MSNVALNGTKDILSKAIKNFATKDQTSISRPSDIKISIAMSDVTIDEPSLKNPVKRTEGEPYYRIIKNDEPYLMPRKIKVHPGQAITDEVSFLQILDAKVDFFQYGILSKPYLQGAFKRLTNELNADMLNNEGFAEYVKSEQLKIDGTDKNEAELKAEYEKVENEIISRESVAITDLEIVVTTPKREIIQGKGIDEPIEPIPFLFAKGECKRQLNFAKDIFEMEL